MSRPFLFALLTLFAHRVQRIVTTDIWPPSVWFRTRFIPGSYWHEFFSCPWCSGTFIAAAVFAVVAQIVSLPLPVLQALAGAAVVGLLGEWESK